MGIQLLKYGLIVAFVGGGCALERSPVDDFPIDSVAGRARETTRARCLPTFIEMVSKYSFLGDRSETLTAAMQGKWIRCETHRPQFEESFGIDVRDNMVCIVEPTPTGALETRLGVGNCRRASLRGSAGPVQF